MIDYNQINDLFGAPLNTVPRPQVPFKLEIWHVVIGGIALGLVAYGAYSLHKDFLSKEAREKRFKAS